MKTIILRWIALLVLALTIRVQAYNTVTSNPSFVDPNNPFTAFVDAGGSVTFTVAVDNGTSSAFGTFQNADVYDNWLSGDGTPGNPLTITVTYGDGALGLDNLCSIKVYHEDSSGTQCTSGFGYVRHGAQFPLASMSLANSFRPRVSAAPILIDLFYNLFSSLFSFGSSAVKAPAKEPQIFTCKVRVLKALNGTKPLSTSIVIHQDNLQKIHSTPQ